MVGCAGSGLEGQGLARRHDDHFLPGIVRRTRRPRKCLMSRRRCLLRHTGPQRLAPRPVLGQMPDSLPRRSSELRSYNSHGLTGTPGAARGVDLSRAPTRYPGSHSGPLCRLQPASPRTDAERRTVARPASARMVCPVDQALKGFPPLALAARAVIMTPTHAVHRWELALSKASPPGDRTASPVLPTSRLVRRHRMTPTRPSTRSGRARRTPCRR
jgi:hypothetical protein